ncbi:MFS transporter [Haloactinopolyspora sp.]|uniref:MFS transporter n=1 Tax=Haloactinopolyspora sp. TaxID=1966353 RepID=UPI002614900A|nr:MFS transporter [Haloactinopolyspora sp.]
MSPTSVHRAKRREEKTLVASALTNGPAELIDFILPLWAGISLGVSATEVGMLVALEMAVSVLVRPLAGVLADTRERKLVAATGALLYGLACCGYALADSISTAYVAAALSGVGGALLWVSVRAIVGERLADDSGVYPRLMASRETGTWVAFVSAMMLLNVIDFTGVFLGCAAACFAAAGVLALSPRRPMARDAHGGADAAATRFGGLGRRLRPMLVAVAVTMTAEGVVAMLLLLHLQRGFDLEVVEVAYVFLPGAIVMSVLPEYVHRLVVRYGRTRVLASASVASASFAASLAWAPNPVVIAGLWILSGAAWAAVMPVQEAVIAEASGERTGRGMGLYEAAALVGGAVGALAAGLLYDTSSWTTACLVAAVIILCGVVIMPRAVRVLGVQNFPPPPPTAPSQPEPEPEPEPASQPLDADADDDDRAEQASGQPKSPRALLADLGAHALLFTVAQIVLLFLDLSWIQDLLTTDDPVRLLLSGGSADHEKVAGLVYGTGRIWLFVLLIDAVVRAVQISRARRGTSETSGA